MNSRRRQGGATTSTRSNPCCHLLLITACPLTHREYVLRHNPTTHMLSTVSSKKQLRLPIESTWDGHPIGDDEAVDVTIHSAPRGWQVEVVAPYHGDTPPDTPAGLLDGLWEYEVVELFIAGPRAQYLELEMGPLGHILVLCFDGLRHRAGPPIAVEYHARITGSRWTGCACLPTDLLPPGPHRANAHAIHGEAPRRYLSHRATPGDQPDFHRLDRLLSVALPPAGQG